MKVLNDTCQQVATRLKQLERNIKALQTDLDFFEERAARWLVEQVDLRLQSVGSQLAAVADKVSREHGGGGVVCIVTEHDGSLLVTWDEKRVMFPVGEGAWKFPRTTLPAKWCLDYIGELRRRLYEGEWEPAVSWLQQHGGPVKRLWGH